MNWALIGLAVWAIVCLVVIGFVHGGRVNEDIERAARRRDGDA